MTLESIIQSIGKKPYYQDEAVVIYCADNRDILPLIPDKSVDLVTTSPPYNIGKKYGDTFRGHFKLNLAYLVTLKYNPANRLAGGNICQVLAKLSLFIFGKWRQGGKA